MQKKKVLVTGGAGMLAYDFYKYQKEKFEIILVDKNECDITSFESILQCIAFYNPDILLNCAAYTAVDDAESEGAKRNYDINVLGVYFLAKATVAFGVEFITISTDYVFDGKNPHGYIPTDIPNPINSYGMAKYLGEKLALDANPHTKIIRTGWLYGGEIWQKSSQKYPDTKNGIFKNFVNTMLFLSETNNEIRVIDDQFGRPTNCKDLSEFILQLIDSKDNHENIFHFSSACEEFSLSWADFAEKIFEKYHKNTYVKRISTSDYKTPARRPQFSILLP